MRAPPTVTFLLLAAAELAAVASPGSLRIGQSLSELKALAGAQHLQEGGPDSQGFHHFEMSGPLAERLSGSSDGTIYLVFRSLNRSSQPKLIHASWKLGGEHVPVLLRQFDIEPGNFNTQAPLVCTGVSPLANLAIAASPQGRTLQAVLEAKTSQAQVRPKYVDLCATNDKGSTK